MRKPFLALLTGALVLVLSAGAGASLAGSSAGQAGDDLAQRGTDNLGSKQGEKRAALRSVGLQKLASGELPEGTKVAQVAKGQYVELAREGEDSIWTVVGEFGTQVNPALGGSPGPLHNEIPEPDRSVDNTTIWTSDFSQPYYNDLLFNDGSGANSMRNFYKEQSSNRYTVNGEVTDWVQVPFNEANYGANYCGDIVCARTWLFVRDSVNAWYADQVAAGASAADINADLAQFDVWDRNDYNGNGNFDEPDGYIDHFQSVHAGEGEETGGGAQGTDAIWSHRWYAFEANTGTTGPPFNLKGGIQIGSSDYWIGDYTIEPENGGVGVFSHEFAHDLGLPDEYDTSGNTGGAENSTAWWTLMSQGSYGTQTDDLGTSPTHMNAWDKFQLGWLNYEVASAGQKSEHKLGPAEYNTKQAQGVFVVLPQKEVTNDLGAPYAGTSFYYSGTADDSVFSITKSVALPAGAASFAAKARYNIETDWDYAYLLVNGTPVHTNLSVNTDPHQQNHGEGVTGVQPNWVDLTADLSAFAGQTVDIAIQYVMDAAQQGEGGVSTPPPGLQLDDIAITGQPVDGAETDGGWTFDPAEGGFRVTTGSESQLFNNYYLAENRQYTGYDLSLRLGPYNFGFPSSPDLVEHFPYQDGVLIWYWDTSQSDNNVGDHPGEGLILPIDSHPAIQHWADGSVMRPRLQAFDATFGLQATDAITVHGGAGAAAVTIPSRPAVSVFDDLQDWWVSGDPGDAPGNGRYQSEWNSVNVPKTGTQIRIKSETKGGFTQIEVAPSK